VYHSGEGRIMVLPQRVQDLILFYLKLILTGEAPGSPLVVRRVTYQGKVIRGDSKSKLIILLSLSSKKGFFLFIQRKRDR